MKKSLCTDFALLFSSKWGQNESQMRPGSVLNEARMDEEWGPNGWRMRPEWIENEARMDEEWDGGGLGMDSSLNGLMDWVLSRPDWRRIEAGLERNWGLNDVRPHLISPVCCWAWEMDSGCYRNCIASRRGNRLEVVTVLMVDKRCWSLKTTRTAILPYTGAPVIPHTM